MKNIKRIFALFLCLAVMATAASLTACDNIFSGGDGECEHKFGDWTVEVSPNCTADGTMIRTCELCEESETSTLKATGHAMGEWKFTTPVTCEKDGVRTRACTNKGCDYSENEPISAMGHSGTVMCDTCGKSLVAAPEINDENWSKIGIVVEKLSFTGVENSWFAADDVVNLTLGDAYVALDEDGALAGYGEAILEITDIDDNKSVYDLIFYIEKDIVYAAIESESAENKYTSFNINDVKGVSEIKEMLEKLEEEEAPEVDGALIDKAIAELVNSFFVVEKNVDGSSTIVLDDLKTLKEINDNLANTTADSILMLVPKYKEIKLLLTSNSTYNFSVSVFEGNFGINILDLVTKAEEAIDKMTKGECKTIAEFIASIDGLDIPDVIIAEQLDVKALLADEEFKKNTTMIHLLQIIVYGGIVEDNPDTPDVDESATAQDTIKTAIQSIFTYLGEKTLYDVIIDGIDPAILDMLLPEGEVLTSESMHELIADLIEVVEEHGNVLINVDKKGNLTSAQVELKITKADGLGIALDYNMTYADGSASVSLKFSSSSVAYETKFEIIPDHSVEIDTEAVERIKANIAD